jgi:hypothetical protein
MYFYLPENGVSLKPKHAANIKTGINSDMVGGFYFLLLSE